MTVQVKNLIQKPLSLFITTTCPFCINANKLAVRQGVNPEVVRLDETSEGPAIRRELTELTDQRTVPYVFSKGEFIGGFTDLAKKSPEFWNSLK